MFEVDKLLNVTLFHLFNTATKQTIYHNAIASTIDENQHLDICYKINFVRSVHNRHYHNTVVFRFNSRSICCSYSTYSGSQTNYGHCTVAK